VRFQLSLSQSGTDGERDDSEQTATFVDAPADLVPGTYEGGLKTWECALDLAAYLDRDVLGAQAAGAVAEAGRRVCGSRVLEVSFFLFPLVGFSVVVADEGGCGSTLMMSSWVAGPRCLHSSS
jgi:hypothetical protein